MFSDRAIAKAVEAREIVIEPYDPELLQPASIDLRLGDEFLTFDPAHVACIDPAIDQSDELYARHIAEEDYYVHSGDFVIATTVEYLEFPHDIVGRIEGKSSLGRLGILVHATAGFMDPGFKGNVTLEIANISPASVRLYVGMPIAQMSFDRLNSPARRGYTGKYQGQRGPQPSAYWKNFQPGGYMHKVAQDLPAGHPTHPHGRPEEWREDGKCIWKSCGVWKSERWPGRGPKVEDRVRNHMDCWSGGEECMLGDPNCPMRPGE